MNIYIYSCKYPPKMCVLKLYNTQLLLQMDVVLQFRTNSHNISYKKKTILLETGSENHTIFHQCIYNMFVEKYTVQRVNVYCVFN